MRMVGLLPVSHSHTPLTARFAGRAWYDKLRDAGVAQDQAEAHAEAAREFIMTELATHSDLAVLRTDLDVLRRELENKLDTLTLRLTVRMGIMLAAGLSILAAVLRLHA
jgi:hypothetical protein